MDVRFFSTRYFALIGAIKYKFIRDVLNVYLIIINQVV